MNPIRNKFKESVKNVFAITLPLIILIGVISELVFTFVVPASQIMFSIPDTLDSLTINVFEPNKSWILTKGFLAKKPVHLKINNHGWININDYEIRANRTNPLIAVVGDSYIEARQVDTEKHIGAQLNSLVGGSFDVYTFGRSGYPLSQYLHVSRFIAKKYDPDILIINIVYNDLDESLDRIKHVPSWLHIKVEDSISYEIEPQKPVAYKLRTKLFF